MTEGAQFARVLERIGRDVLARLSDLSDELLNQPVPLPAANSLFALATHLAGAGEFWAVAVPGRRPIARDREAEFRATGTHAELVERYDRWLAAVHEVLDAMPDTMLEQQVDLPAGYRRWVGDEPVTVRDCLLHAVEHSALHLGHIEITRQVLGIP
jgi:uncharacterized damage-inducible protein DinB